MDDKLKRAKEIAFKIINLKCKNCPANDGRNTCHADGNTCFKVINLLAYEIIKL